MNDEELLEALDRLAKQGVLPIVYDVEEDERDWSEYVLIPASILVGTSCLLMIASLFIWAIFAIWSSIWNM